MKTQNEYNIRIGRKYWMGDCLFEVVDVTMLKPYCASSNEWEEGVTYKRLGWAGITDNNTTFTVTAADFATKFIPISLETGDKVELFSMGKSRGVIEVEDEGNADNDEFCVTFKDRSEKARKHIDPKTRRVDVVYSEQATDYYIFIPNPTTIASVDDIIGKLEEYKKVLSGERVGVNIRKIYSNIASIKRLIQN